MNEHNHKRVIYEFANRILHGEESVPESVIASLKECQDSLTGKNVNPIETLEKASKFTDSIYAETDYFFYHFYYDIDVKGNKLRLSRVNQGLQHSASSMDVCGDLRMDSGGLRRPQTKPFKGTLRDQDGRIWLSGTDEKEFFSMINDRKKSRHRDLADIGNQSDNVAFLHAMGACYYNGDVLMVESEEKSRSLFEEHLKKCFSEYLIVKNETDALFLLGIALHGIMDSFTPSHMGFQWYMLQDMGLHAQGDVIPIEKHIYDDSALEDELDYEYVPNNSSNHSSFRLYREKVKYDPGQITKASVGDYMLAKMKKGYNDDDELNGIEYVDSGDKNMFKIFLEIGAFPKTDGYEDAVIEGLSKGEIDISFSTWREVGDTMYPYLVKRSLMKLNKQLFGIHYTEEAFIYSNTAIETMISVFSILNECRRKCQQNNIFDFTLYNYEKSDKDGAVERAFNAWKTNYDNLGNIRSEHLNLDLYRK